jgi:hypothetical protein
VSREGALRWVTMAEKFSAACEPLSSVTSRQDASEAILFIGCFGTVLGGLHHHYVRIRFPAGTATRFRSFWPTAILSSPIFPIVVNTAMRDRPNGGECVA